MASSKKPLSARAGRRSCRPNDAGSIREIAGCCWHCAHFSAAARNWPPSAPRRQGQQRVMAGAPVTVGVVATRRAFLLAVAGDDRGIHVQRHLLQRANLSEEPTVGFGLHSFVAQHVEAGEQAHDGLVAGRFRPAEQPHQRTVHPHRYFSVFRYYPSDPRRRQHWSGKQVVVVGRRHFLGGQSVVLV